jgi:aspartate-semialdehyde dehydrogenase
MARSTERVGRRRPVNIALFDSSTLIGKGVKSHLALRKFPVGKVLLFDTGAVEGGGNLSEFSGEPMLAARPALEEMERIDLAFLCGRPGSGRDYLDWPGRSRFVAIDLTLSANALATVPVVNAAVNLDAMKGHAGVVASPHPVSQFLSTVFAPISRRLPLSEVVSVVMQPVSEEGEKGIEELYRQTVGLLSFTEVPKDLFGRVLAFNLVPASLAAGEGAGDDWVAREVSAILGQPGFPHAVKILLVPVFHCHAFVSRVRFREPVAPHRLREVLGEESSIRVQEGGGGATPAELVGEEKIVLGEIRPDPSAPESFWIWGITDNLATGASLNAVRIAEGLVESGSLAGRRTP